MPARPSASPDAFQEAVDWFRARLPMTQAEFESIAGASHARAFTIANVAQLDVVNHVWNALDSALAQGTSFNDFRKAVEADLAAAWGKPNSAVVETIFRNGVQSAYGRGRWYQQMDPELKQDRPFLKLSVIMDGRTSKVCAPLANTVLEADDPFWKTHWPPLHHRCRSTTISLTRDQAMKQGPPTTPPSAPAAEGFGGAPGQGEWAPDYTRYPAHLAEEAKRKAAVGDTAKGPFAPEVKPTVVRALPEVAPPAPAPRAPEPRRWAPVKTADAAMRQIEELGPKPLEGAEYKAAGKRFGRKAFVLSRKSVEGRALAAADRVAYLNRAGETLVDLTTRFPKVAQVLEGGDVRFLPGPSSAHGMMAYASNAKTGVLTTPYHLSFGPLVEDGYAQRMVDYQVKRGARWTVGGNRVESNVRHEVAHLVEYKGGVDLKPLMAEIRAAAGVQGERVWIRKHVSEYAASSDSETFAELVAMVTEPGYARGTLPGPVEAFILKTLETP